MSQFSNLLNNFIKESSFTIKKLSNECQIDRTVIQKYISGERLPSSYKNIEKIINKLTLTEKQKKSLKKAYDIERTGIDKYNRLIKLKEIIETLHLYSSNQIKINYNFNNISSIATNLNELIVLSHFIMNDAIHSESKTIKICIPTNNKLYENIISTLNIHDDLFLKQIIHLENDFQNNRNMLNLIQFENIFSSLYFYNTIVKYNYDNFISTLSNYVSYPYMIHSEHYSMLIDSQITSGILLTDEINKYLIKQFDEEFNKANLYCSHHSSSFGYLQYWNSIKHYDSFNFYIFSNKPALLFVLDDDLLNRHFLGNKEDYEIIKTYFHNYKKHIYNLSLQKQIHIYFTKSGLESFINSGTTEEFPNKYMTPMDKDECILMLKRLINMTHNSHYQLHMINENLFKLPEHCIISFQENGNIMIVAGKSEEENQCIDISESTVCKEFYNLENIIEIEEYLYNQEYSSLYLKTFMKQHTF